MIFVLGKSFRAHLRQSRVLSQAATLVPPFVFPQTLISSQTKSTKPNAPSAPSKKLAMSFHDLYSSGLRPPRCPVCRATKNLLRCGGCKVVNYCGPAHQSSDRPEHKTECNAIKKARQILEQAEAELRAKPSDFALPEDVFNTAVGHFWGILDTRPYMRARFAFVEALLKAKDCKPAVELALDNLLDMLRLCRGDNMGLRDFVPALMLRLGREQECYDFIKWWATGTDADYDWSDTTLPYLNVHGADCFEPVDKLISEYGSLSHLVILTLLKLRFYLELESFQVEAESSVPFGAPLDVSDIDTMRPLGEIVRSKLKKMSMEEGCIMVDTLKEQYDTLRRAVSDRNPWFWDLLVEEEDPSLVAHYSHGSKEEAELTLKICLHAWQETEDAILMISTDTTDSAPAYESCLDDVDNIRAALDAPLSSASGLEKRRGGLLNVFPSSFTPPTTTIAPTSLFRPSTSDGAHPSRLVMGNDPKKVLVYVDGACTDNGQPGLNPRGGWAVVYGPRPSDFVSGQLEQKGPFDNHAYVPTSSRAELRAAIAAMRLCDWRREGFTSIMIATDSTYVVDGATSWLQNWVRNGWRTKNRGEVKNQDLWQLLLGEVERWDLDGVGVGFWRIPRELNQRADSAAKQAAREGTSPPLDFQDVVLPPSATISPAPSGRPAPRILTICLEWEDMFNEIYAGLISKISSKAKMDRAATPEAAFQFLNQSPPPSVILITDGGIARKNQKKLWQRVIDHLRGGATVVLAGCFSSMLNTSEFDRFFALANVPWRRGSYYRTDVKLSRPAVPADIAEKLPASYSQKAQYIRNVEFPSRWYSETERIDAEAAVAFGQVDSGFLGYVGDVNPEKGSESVVLAMCGLLD